jgi:hypothetical protein
MVPETKKEPGILDPLLSNNVVAAFLKYFESNSGVIFTVCFVVLVFFFGNLIDYILVNQTDAVKSSIFIKYSVRWWTLIFCLLLVLNLLISFIWKPAKNVNKTAATSTAVTK